MTRLTVAYTREDVSQSALEILIGAFEHFVLVSHSYTPSLYMNKAMNSTPCSNFSSNTHPPAKYS